MRYGISKRKDAKSAKITKKERSFFFAFLLCVFALSAIFALSSRAVAQSLYDNDFRKATDGDVPKGIDVLNGSFAIKTVDGRKTIEIPGDPVDAYGALFGPENETNLCVQSTIVATATGKRTPEFGVGLADANGYKLWIMPATSRLQIIKGEVVVTSVAFNWKSGVPTTLKLEARKDGDHTIIEGKAWLKGEAEPKDWQIKFEEKGEAPKGRASIWGSPYSSTPIRFTDLVLNRAGK